MSGFLIQLDRECQYKAQPNFAINNPVDLTPEQVESWLLHLIRDRKLSYLTARSL